MTLKRGVAVQGQVTDPDGKPIKDAKVVRGSYHYAATTPRKFSTDAEGRFRLPALKPQKTKLTVIAAGWAPQLREVELKEDMPPQNFQMALGNPLW